MSSDIISEKYDSNWGSIKLGKLMIYAKDLLENGKRPILPSKSFYSNWSGTTKQLAVMCKKILNYLKFKSPYTLRVSFSKNINSPGQFTFNKLNAKITISKQFQNNSTACAAILAHEICHLVLFMKGIKEDNIYENERFTDFATVYFGLGVLVLNGKEISYKPDAISLIQSLLGILGLVFAGFGFISNPFRKRESSFGYWKEDEYYTIFLGYVVRNNLDLGKISPYIKKNLGYAGV